MNCCMTTVMFLQTNNMFYESHKQLIERVCMALDQTDKTEDIVTLLLGEKTKLKFKKDPNRPKKPKSGFLFFCDEERGKLIEIERKKNKKVEHSYRNRFALACLDGPIFSAKEILTCG